jgi:hypothetical protein
MEKRNSIVKRTGRILMVAILLGIGGQLALPLAAHARNGGATHRRAHCASVPVPGKPGAFVVHCTTARI